MSFVPIFIQENDDADYYCIDRSDSLGHVGLPTPPAKHTTVALTVICGDLRLSNTVTYIPCDRHGTFTYAGVISAVDNLLHFFDVEGGNIAIEFANKSSVRFGEDDPVWQPLTSADYYNLRPSDDESTVMCQAIRIHLPNDSRRRLLWRWYLNSQEMRNARDSTDEEVLSELSRFNSMSAY